MGWYPIEVYDKHGKAHGTVSRKIAWFCLRKEIASKRDHLGNDIVSITINVVIPTCIKLRIDLEKMDDAVLEALKANETA